MEPEIIKTSYSALDTFKQCPLKYKFQQIDKIKAPKSKEAIFGNKIHKTLQYFHSTQPISPTLDELLNYLKDIWPEKEENIFLDEQEDMIYFSEAIKILRNYYNHYLKIKDKSTVIDIETRFEVLLEKPPEKCLLRGIIDRIDKTADGIEIIDYKTTKRLPSQQDIDNSLQLSLYCLGLINRWPKFVEQGLEKIKLTFYYLKHQETISTRRTKEQLNDIQEQIWERLAEIEKSDFKPIPSALCGWCGYKNLCPMWKHKYSEQRTVNSEQINKIIEEFLELKKNNQKNNKRLIELKQIINNYLDKEKLERIFGDIGYITRLSLTRYEYELEKIKEILEPLGKWQDVLAVDSIKLKNLIKTLSYSIRKQIEKAKKIDKEYKILKASVKKKKREKS